MSFPFEDHLEAAEVRNEVRFNYTEMRTVQSPEH